MADKTLREMTAYADRPYTVTEVTHCPKCGEYHKMNKPVPGVRCFVCTKFHAEFEDTFLTFKGNVMVGLEGGIIGNNLDDDGRVIVYQFVCRTTECVEEALSDGVPEFKKRSNDRKYGRKS